MATDSRELEAMRKELDAQKLDAQEARKALEEKLTEERIRSGALDPDEARIQQSDTHSS